MKKIKLTQGKFALVDDEDFEKFNKIKWFCNGMGYACRSLHPNTSSCKSIYLHKEIMNNPLNMEVDHINGNPLDNRKINLRKCSHQENGRNLKISKRNTIGYKGLYFYRKIKRWQVYITCNYKHIYVGIFKSKKDAALAYNQKARELFGEFARLNQL